MMWTIWCLIDISGEKAQLETLCNHKTSWHTQSSHCHPTWSWDGRRILYASDFGGRVQLYLIEVVEALGTMTVVKAQIPYPKRSRRAARVIWRTPMI